MKIGIPKEIHAGERRVAATPKSVEKMVELGFSVAVQQGAGTAAAYVDQAYVDAGAELVTDTRSLWQQSDIVLKVREPEFCGELDVHEADLLPSDATLLSFIWPAQNTELVDRLAKRGASVFAMDAVPRISRAQKLDALSSMANIAGYRAIIEAANQYGSLLGGQITAAGRITPAKVLVIGAGVAGLAALAAAKSLGAIVRAFDTRAAVKEQVMSLGAEFLELDFEESGDGAGGYAKVMSEAFIAAEMALFREQAREVDIVVTTALIPGKKAPTLWTADMVQAMKAGSVVVDLASEQGGNCELTEPGQLVTKHGVHLIGFTDMPSRLATTASQLYATNLTHFLDELGGAENFSIDLENEVVRGSLIAHKGETTWPPPKPKVVEKPAGPVEAPPKKTPLPPQASAAPVQSPSTSAPSKSATGAGRRPWLWGVALALAVLWGYLRFGVDAAALGPEAHQFIKQLTVFVLACFVGWQVVWSVTPALHTPLMSVTNAISGIIILGGLLVAKLPIDAPLILGAIAVLLAMINISGGFLVSQRMLRMFRK